MIRITNSMMNNNTKNNINLNKTSADKLNTMVATGQKITKPSDDPVIAIRALRLNTSLAQLNQYYEKNIPDAQAWMTITETALSQTDGIFTSIKENLTTGASDDNTASDRMKILESLKALRDQVYSSGNADYAGRTVFTGYRTGESLSVLSTDNLEELGYKSITQPITADDISSMKKVVDNNPSGTAAENDIQTVEINRIRLAYDKLDECDITIKGKKLADIPLKPETTVTDSMYTDGQDHFITETGEIILSDATKKKIEAAEDVTIEYAKSSFRVGDLRPEHYFACEDKKGIHYNCSSEEVDDEEKPILDETGNPTGEYEKKTNYYADFQEQDIQYEVSFNQTISINTHANDVYPHDIGRDVDDLLIMTQSVIDAGKELDKLKNDPTVDKDSEDYKKAEKKYALLSDECQKMFSDALTKFDGYSDKLNLHISNIGSMRQRLTITKERVSDQLQSFKELADENINANLTDTAIDLSNAQLALEAAQMAASKIAQQTLLNYL